MLRPLLLTSFLFTALWGLIVPAALAVALRRRWGSPWRVIGYGSLVFFLFQVVTRIPALQLAQSFLREPLQASASFRVLWIAAAAVTAGLFEEVGRCVGYRWWARDARSWRDGVAFGIGHGGLEMLLLGGLSGLAAVVGYVVYVTVGAEARVPPGQEAALAAARQAYATMPAWLPLLGAFERLAALILQISLSLMVLRVFTGGGPKWLVAAIAYHALVDFVPVMILLRGGTVTSNIIPDPGRALGAEAMVAVFAAFSLWLIVRFRNVLPSPLSHPHSDTVI